MEKFLQGLLFINLLGGVLYAQTPSDALMMKQREICFAITYDQGSWDHYWEGTDLRINENVGTFARRMIMPMVAIGLHDKLNLIIAVPHIKTESKEPNGGFLQGVSGFQDISFNLKAQLLEKQIGTSELSLFTNVGFSTPITNYLSDYMPYSIGFGANEFSLRTISRLELHNGFYVQASLAHLWRGRTEIERDYYYNNGSYYTSLMDVPDAWNVGGALGIWLLNNSLRLEANYVSVKSIAGDDIRSYNAPQPTNKAEAGQVGFTTQYYIKQGRGFGVLAYYSKIISGRNTGQFTTIGGGVTYQFKL